MNLPLLQTTDEVPYLDNLNAAQRAAVLATDGPVLVLAGAGTGKTKVLTTRIVHLLATGKAMPGEILAVTFTNKAAAEMRERISTMIGASVEGWFLGTFHALATRMLRPHAERVGLRPNFTILGDDDQIRLMKQLLEAEGIDDKKSPARVVMAVISRWKDRGLRPADVAHETGGTLANGKLPKLYAQYQTRLQELNACDFGDLLLHHLTLLRENADILDGLRQRFRYILVDEYQDTNTVQYLWLRLLAGRNEPAQSRLREADEVGVTQSSRANICCVGDEDQSIYGWRGAEIGNILRFEEDFPGAEVIRLEQNYRSTGHILGAASQLIARNTIRLGKTLWTESDHGHKVRVQTLWDGEEEARWVGDEIESLQRSGVRLSAMAVMVRAGFQTRQFEERFISLGIPYRVLVGARFYERAEIRDAMAYIRLLASPEDDLAFERIINTPKRGVGPAAIQQLQSYARAERIPLLEAMIRLVETDQLKPKLRTTLRDLTQAFQRWRGLLQNLPHAEVAQIALDESGYTGMWQADKSPEAPGRLDNLKELVGAMAGFDTLPAFLEHVSLVLEATDKNVEDQVSLMTLHGAKGLEFDIVFLPGWEEEIFPSRLSLEENGAKGLEEERRLAYVGITRAKQRAFISHVANRHLHGNWINALPSRFLNELPAQHIDRHSTISSGAMNFGMGAPRRQRWDDEDRGSHRAPSIFQQIKVGQSYTKKNTPQIEGHAHEIRHTVNPDAIFNLGDRVIHDKFGNGTIRRVDGEKLDIAFDKAGLKKMMAGFVTKPK